MTAGPVLIAGGGPAGAAAAIRLAEAGVDAVLVERSRGAHDKVCGEFLSGETLAFLDRLGIDAAALGALPIRRLGVPSGGGVEAVALPFPAASLSRRLLDEALLARAEAAGASIRRGVAVRGFTAGEGGIALRLDGGETLSGRALVVATGKHDLGGLRRAGPQQGLVGFKMHYALPAPADGVLSGRTDLLGLAGGYAGLQRVGTDGVNLCLLAPATRAAEAGGFHGLVGEIRRRAPHADRLLAAAVPLFERPLAVAGLPYGFVRRTGEGVRWVGDQAAVIPSFTGDGLAIALWTGMAAAESLLAGETADAFQARVARRLKAQVGRATLLSRLMVRPWFQRLAASAVARAPVLARAAARATRLSPA